MGYSRGKQWLLQHLQGADVGRVVDRASADRISTKRINPLSGAVVQDVSRDLIEHQGSPVVVVLSGCHTGWADNPPMNGLCEVFFLIHII
jgi:hypothetical protein